MLLTVFIAGVVHGEEGPGCSRYPKQVDRTGADRHKLVQLASNSNEISQLPLPLKVSRPSGQDRSVQLFKQYNPSQNIKQSANVVKDQIPVKHIPPIGHRDAQPLLSLSDQIADTDKDSIFSEGSQLVSGRSNKELSLDVDDLDIPWSDLVLKERIGAGILLYRIGVKT